MPCIVKKTFEAALDANSHLLVQVKDNQPSLLCAIEQAAETKTPSDHHETRTQNMRLRDETRAVEVFDAGPILKATPWNGLVKAIIRVKRTTLIRRAKDGMWDKREEVSFYVCSTMLGAKKANDAIRGHWGVENRNHYVRDVSMLEDASRIRINPGIFARTRSFALNILRANGAKNIADALWCNALDFNKILKYRYR